MIVRAALLAVALGLCACDAPPPPPEKWIGAAMTESGWVATGVFVTSKNCEASNIMTADPGQKWRCAIGCRLEGVVEVCDYQVTGRGHPRQ